MSVSLAFVSEAAARDSKTVSEKPFTIMERMLIHPKPRRDEFMQSLLRFLRRYDRNGDGLTLDEIQASLRGKPKARQVPTENAALSTNSFTIFNSLLEHDPNKDGHLTENEFNALANEAFRRHDKNGNSVMDAEEIEPLRVRVKALIMDNYVRSKVTANKKKYPCELPKPTADEQVVVLGTYRGASISTVFVFGPDDVTTTRPVIIEPGETPLYVVLTSKTSVIWKFEGAIQRVSRALIITSGYGLGTGAGVTGLKSKQVQFLAPRTCPTYTHSFSVRSHPRYRTAKQKDRAERAIRVKRLTMETIIGRRVDVFAGVKNSEIAHLPSGSSSKMPDRDETDTTGLDARAQQFYLEKFPGGVDKVDPSTVIAPKPVGRYPVLPQYAGLLQLLRDNAIEKVGEKEYRIRTAIPHLPANLQYGHAMTFRLGKGVPLPGGTLGASCVISEATGKQLNKSAKCPTK